MYEDENVIKSKLTLWSYSLYTTLPDFIRKELLYEREVLGSVKISMIDTEKLLAYMVEIELQNR